MLYNNQKKKALHKKKIIRTQLKYDLLETLKDIIPLILFWTKIFGNKFCFSDSPK